MNSESHSLVPRGVRAAVKVGARAEREALAAFRAGGNTVKAFADAMQPMSVLLVDLMVTAHLFGARRVLLMAPTIKAQRSPHEESVDFMRRRLKISLADIAKMEAAYGIKAISVVSDTISIIERKVQRTLLQIRAEGLTVRDGVQELRKTFAKAGIVPDNKFTLEAIFRTQTQLAYSTGLQATLKDPALQEILWGFKYVTVGDNRVRDNHKPLEGMTADRDNSVWTTLTPPNGFACRCQVIPLFDKRETVLPSGQAIAEGADSGFAFNPGTILSVPMVPIAARRFSRAK